MMKSLSNHAVVTQSSPRDRLRAPPPALASNAASVHVLDAVTVRVDLTRAPAHRVRRVRRRCARVAQRAAVVERERARRAHLPELAVSRGSISGISRVHLAHISRLPARAGRHSKRYTPPRRRRRHNSTRRARKNRRRTCSLLWRLDNNNKGGGGGGGGGDNSTHRVAFVAARQVGGASSSRGNGASSSNEGTDGVDVGDERHRRAAYHASTSFT